ncbi:MAG: HDOD domain-containing protein [Pseudomonadota bacterium]
MLEVLLKQAGELPSLPEIYIRVTELLESENSTAIRIGETLQTDPALTTRILRLINSAFYGMRSPVTSISQAVTLLGRQQLRQLLTGSVLSSVFKDFNITDFPLRDFWQHCIKSAIIARQLAMQNARVIDHEMFFTVGLIHDIGWLVIAKVNPGSFEQITEIAREEGKDVLDVELEKLGVTHIDVSVALLEQWGMPGSIIECVKKHHQIEHSGPFAVETSIVYLANQLSRFNLYDIDYNDDEDEDDTVTLVLGDIPHWETAKCTAEQIAIACSLADQQWLDVMESLGMHDLALGEALDENQRFNTSFKKL